MTWTPQARERASQRMRDLWQDPDFRARWRASKARRADPPAAQIQPTEKPKYGHRLRRFIEHSAAGAPLTLHPDHPAAVSARTIFRKRVIRPVTDERVLKQGRHNRKIGDKVMKGRWIGMPIYTLTLEERATCPRSCRHWLDCFGNKMNWSPRWQRGEELEARLDGELRALAKRHPRGFVVRLHVLGDFYSLRYVERWFTWLVEIPQLHVFGYTAHAPNSEIGDWLLTMASCHWERFAIRFSNSGLPEMATRTRYATGLRGETPDGVICPAQSEDAECCATCGLCWQSKRNIVFLGH